MVYLKNFTLLDELQEHDIVCCEEIRRIFNNYYPLHLFSTKSFKNIDFDKITIFYGGNGSGKTTLINIISEKLNASRKSSIDKGSYFDLYVKHCDYEMSFDEPTDIKLITSDDVFDYLLDVRSINANVTDLCSEKKGLAMRVKEEVEGAEKPITYVVLTEAGMNFVPSDED